MNSDSRFYRSRNGVVVEVRLDTGDWEIWLQTKSSGDNKHKRQFVDGGFATMEDAIAAAYDHKFSSEDARQLMKGIDVLLDPDFWQTGFPPQELTPPQPASSLTPDLDPNCQDRFRRRVPNPNGI